MKVFAGIICASFLLLHLSGNSDNLVLLQNGQVKVAIDCQHLAMEIQANNSENFQVSAPVTYQNATIEKQTQTNVVINYPNLEKRIFIKLKDETIDISIESGKNDHFQWPTINKFSALTIPFHQGKFIPANDSVWVNYLNGRSYSGLEDLSMQFFATDFGKHALLYLISNPFNNTINFHKKSGHLALAFDHEFPTTVAKKEYGFSIRIVDDSPTTIAKEYQKHVIETSGIKTLEEKATTNPNIRKLYGAANFYVWSQEFLSTENIHWDGLIKFWIGQTSEMADNPTKHIFELLKNNKDGTGAELLKAWNEILKNKYANVYQKNLILRSLNEVLSSKNFYDKAAWKSIQIEPLSKMFLNNGKPLNETELYQLNKQTFYSAFKPYVETTDHWGDGVSIDILKVMHHSGIQKAWIGLNEWKPAFIHPDFVKTANEMGYLISPYDDYHSIHEPGDESWNTAAFEDPGLYESATVTNKDGKKSTAFLGIGRKFNPTLAFPSVKKRVNGILNQGIQFNSWFVDCDGTSEFLDDYTPGRMTSQEEDMNARLKRLAWISNDKNMVVGTEVGNDFCASVIAFAHGMTTPVIEWSDPDMRKNKESEYYLGDYFSIDGGIPSKFVKEVKIKPLYKYIYFDNRFNLPLFQLVYNNSVITSHHWESGTLKFPDLTKDRELEEILYDVPPMYHIDRKEWAKHKNIICRHIHEFSPIHEKAVLMQMLSFNSLNKDCTVQMTRFGTAEKVKLELVANFLEDDFSWSGVVIPAKSIWINDLESGSYHIYTP